MKKTQAFSDETGLLLEAGRALPDSARKRCPACASPGGGYDQNIAQDLVSRLFKLGADAYICKDDVQAPP